MTAEVLSYLRHLPTTAEERLTDGELLRWFARGEQAPFTELLQRHGPLVWGGCRRVLGDAHAAEDAFQATFLRLVQRAGALRSDGSLAGWLHTVATRIARRARLAEQRRRRRDRTYVPSTPASADELTCWTRKSRACRSHTAYPSFSAISTINPRGKRRAASASPRVCYAAGWSAAGNNCGVAWRSSVCLWPPPCC